jgi:hypothetical protein
MQQQQQLVQSLHSSESKFFVRRGVCMDNPQFNLTYGPAFGQATYAKLHVDIEGHTQVTQVPTDVLMETDDWEMIRFNSANGKHVFLACRRVESGLPTNRLWDKVRELFSHVKCPKYCGDMVFFREHDDLTWTREVLLRELVNWLVRNKVHKQEYSFPQ